MNATLFYEYFHGDSGVGLGASHQTAWMGLIAQIIMALNVFDAGEVLEIRILSRGLETTGGVD